jgi:ribonuclease HII
MKKILGIDEAGRGCVIGPMVIAGVLISEEKLGALVELGAQDSKALERSQRERIAPRIESLADATQTIILTPQEIDRTNVNQLELHGMAALINALNPDVVYIDIPVSPPGICNYLKILRHWLQDERVQLIGENKADHTYTIVGAASIVAKVARDRFVTELKEMHGDFGWGYPSEPKTRAFLQHWFEAHGSFPDFVRTKWQTIKRISAQEPEALLNWTGMSKGRLS